MLDELVAGVEDSPDDDDELSEPVVDAEFELVEGVDDPAGEEPLVVVGVGALSDALVVDVVAALAQASTKSNVTPHHLKSRNLIILMSPGPRSQKRA